MKKAVITTSILAVVATASLLSSETDFSKCGTLQGQEVYEEKSIIRLKYSLCDEWQEFDFRDVEGTDEEKSARIRKEINDETGLEAYFEIKGTEIIFITSYHEEP